jgi:hypothetical protein
VENGLTAQQILNVVWGILMAVLAWIGSRFHTRQDSFDKRQRDVENRLEKKLESADLKDLARDLETRFNTSLDRQTKLIVQLFKTRGIDSDD